MMPYLRTLLVLIVAAVLNQGCRSDPATGAQPAGVSLSFQIDSIMRKYIPDDSASVIAYSYTDTLQIHAVDLRKIDQFVLAIYHFHGVGYYPYPNAIGGYRYYPNHSSEHQYSFDMNGGHVIVTSFDGSHISGTFECAGLYQVDTITRGTYLRSGQFVNLPVRVI